MDKAMQAALLQYSSVIYKNGWRAGERLVKEYSKKWPDFKKWAKALRIVIRANELLQEQRKKKK